MLVSKEITTGQCIQCNGPINMTITEKDWWEEKVESTKQYDKDGKLIAEGAHFPRRCKSCRQERKVKRIRENACSTSLRSMIIDYETDKIDVDGLISKLEQLVVDVEALETLANGAMNETEQAGVESI